MQEEEFQEQENDLQAFVSRIFKTASLDFACERRT